MLTWLKSFTVHRLFLLVLVLLWVGLHSQHGMAQKRSGVLTGKEKLGGKATDDQRVNNCKVPAAKRGTKRRPGKCRPEKASSAHKVE